MEIPKNVGLFVRGAHHRQKIGHRAYSKSYTKKVYTGFHTASTKPYANRVDIGLHIGCKKSYISPANVQEVLGAFSK